MNRLIATHHLYQREFQLARAAFERARARDPLSLMLLINLSMLAYAERRYDAARQELFEVLDMDRSWYLPYAHLARLAHAMGHHAEAVEYRAKSFDVRNRNAEAAMLRASFADGDWTGFMRRIVAERERSGLTRMETAVYLAELGVSDGAVNRVQESIDGCDEQIWLLAIDPRLDPLRADARYPGLLKRAGFSPSRKPP